MLLYPFCLFTSPMLPNPAGKNLPLPNSQASIIDFCNFLHFSILLRPNLLNDKKLCCMPNLYESCEEMVVTTWRCSWRRRQRIKIKTCCATAQQDYQIIYTIPKYSLFIFINTLISSSSSQSTSPRFKWLKCPLPFGAQPHNKQVPFPLLSIIAQSYSIV